MSCPGQDTALAITDSQLLQIPMLCLHKNRNINSQAWTEEGPWGPDPSLLNYSLLGDAGREGVIAFSCVAPGDPSTFQWRV